MSRKYRMILLGFLILGLLDGLMSFAFPPDYRLTDFSILSRFYLIGVLVWLYNKDTKTRVLAGLLAGLVFAFLFGGSFPYDPLFFTAAAWLCGMAPKWSNSPRLSWIFFLLFALGYDILPWIWQRIFTPYNANFLLWFWRMETFTMILDVLALYAIRYGADVMDRYFKIMRVRQAREDRRRMARMRASGHAPD